MGKSSLAQKNRYKGPVLKTNKNMSLPAITDFIVSRLDYKIQ